MIAFVDERPNGETVTWHIRLLPFSLLSISYEIFFFLRKALFRNHAKSKEEEKKEFLSWMAKINFLWSYQRTVPRGEAIRSYNHNRLAEKYNFWQQITLDDKL
jgi:hypothetical protein